MGIDHREPVAEHGHDAGVDAGELAGQLDVFGHVDEPVVIDGVVPVDPEQIERVGGVAVDTGERSRDGVGNGRRVGELGHRGQQDLCLAEPGHRPVVAVLVDHGLEKAVAGGVDA